jgi:hypothetical protein
MSLQITHERLGWPERGQILDPSGPGPAVLAQIAKQKLQTAIRRINGCRQGKVGVLTENPTAKTSQSPIAIVVEFPRPISEEALKEVHRLAWNFARSPLLITIDPVTVRSWSCCEPPDPGTELISRVEIPDGRIDLEDTQSLAAHALSWASLVSGDFFRDESRASYFDRNNAADRLLLDNLKEVRKQLHDGHGAARPKLDYPTIHALLARLMFLQFLADRRDGDGNAALNPDFFVQRRRDKTLTGTYESFADVLQDKDDTYRMFRWLNTKFNGDLFPTAHEQEAEEKVVAAEHLRFLAEFIRGDTELRRGQRMLWKQYSFDVIPLELISSIYEEFIRNGDTEPGTGVVYTPPHIVDFILDGVLPWDGDEWELNVLDPACGSGIFLVKAYQRLVHRWKTANKGQRPSAALLRHILERCLFGVDTQDDAIRVASFSLYLAMCDEIDPKRYWTSVRFPKLRGQTISCHDFFDDGPALKDGDKRREFDLVVGNPPWGQEEKLSDAATTWVKTEAARWPSSDKRSWSASYVSIGPLFLPRAAELLAPEGRVALMQSSAVLLNDVGTARQFRERFFREHAVEEVVNLSPLRFILFKNAISPPCVITFGRPKAEAVPSEFVYLCPKPISTVEDEYRLVISPYDVHSVLPKEVSSAHNAMTTFLWGNRRDLALLNKLSKLPTLQSHKAAESVLTREGIIRGNRKAEQKAILDRRILESPSFPTGVALVLDPTSLPVNKDPNVHDRDSTNFDAFEAPQLLIKQSWVQSDLRFHAVRVDAESGNGVICTQAYVSVHTSPEEAGILNSACVVYNSNFTVYWLFMTNQRLASYIPEATVADLLQVPLPDLKLVDLKSLRSLDRTASDDLVQRALALDDFDWALISDFFTYTLPDFKMLPDSPGPKPTKRGERDDELRRYCDYFLRVLEAAFGEKHRFTATIFREDNHDRLAVRLVAIHLKPVGEERVRREAIASLALSERLMELERLLWASGKPGEEIGFQRVARVYSEYRHGRRSVPTLFLIKPDQGRYWTASAGMRDADDAFNEIMLWENKAPGARKTGAS